jgi:hypothetical protein
MWKATTAGWVAVALGYTIDFTSGGTYVIAEGDVITGATSAKTATVLRIVTTSGSFSAGHRGGLSRRRLGLGRVRRREPQRRRQPQRRDDCRRQGRDHASQPVAGTTASTTISTAPRT